MAKYAQIGSLSRLACAIINANNPRIVAAFFLFYFDEKISWGNKFSF